MSSYYTVAPPPTKPQPGVLGAIAHIGGQTLDDLIHSAIGSAGGLIHGGEYAFTHNPIDTISQLPAIGGAMAHQIAADVQHPLRHPGYTLLDLLALAPIPGSFAGRVVTLGGTIARGSAMGADLAAATRGALASGDVGAARQIAAGMGRQGEFSRAIDQQTGLPKPTSTQVSQAILRGAPRQGRLLRTPEGDVIPGWVYSRDPTIKAAQKLVDRAYEGFPGGRPPLPWRVLPPFWSTQSGRISRATTAANVQRAGTLGASAQTLWKKFGGVPDAEHLAARMVIEGITATELRNYHEQILRGEHPDVKVTPRIEKETQRRLGLMSEAEKYLHDVTQTVTGDDGRVHTFQVPELKPEFAGSQIDKYIGSIRSLSGERELALQGIDSVSKESAIARTIGPKHEVLTNTLPQYTEQIAAMERKLASVERMHPNNPEVWQELRDQIKTAKENPPIPMDVAEKLINQANLARVHYDIPRLEKMRSFDTLGYRRAYGGTARPTAPGTITHPFKAEILRTGGGDVNTARTMAMTYTEAQRYISLFRNWQRITASLSDSPDSIPERFRRLVKKPGFANPMTRSEADRFIARKRSERGDEPTKEEAEAFGMKYESLRSGLFPQRILDTVTNTLREVKDMARGEGETAPPGYGWADSRLLGGLDKQNPLIPLLHNAPIARTVVRSLDAINTINKTALLYLKPAYIFPNALGNIALNMVQQGFLFPLNLGKSLYIWNRATPEVRQGILSAMEEGGISAIEKGQPTITGGIQQASRAISRVYGKVVDQPFRISSFLHEAAVDGFTTNKEIEHLVTSPEMRDQFNSIAQRANDAVINYELLSPAEQAIMRRLVFFYPWIKGATRYTAQVYKEHPISTGLQGQVGRMEHERTQRLLGDLPTYLEGVYTSKPKGGFADVQNPSAFSILETPARLAEEFRNIIERNPNPDLALTGELSPSDRMMLDIITAGVTGQKRAASTSGTSSPFRTALQDYYGGNPIDLLISRLRNQQKPTSIYTNQSALRDIEQFALWGNLTKRRINIARANARAYKQKHPSGY